MADMVRKQNEFDLVCGHHIQLAALDQDFTYVGLLECLPTREGNRKRLERWVRGLSKRALHIGRITTASGIWHDVKIERSVVSGTHSIRAEKRS